MKMLIRISNRPKWMDSYGFDENFLLLKICNKPILEFYLDLAQFLGIKDVLVVSSTYCHELANYKKIISPWNVNISYEISPEGESISSFQRRNSRYFNKESIFYILAPVFIYYDLNNDSLKNIDMNEDVIIDEIHNSSRFLYRSLNSIRSFYELSISIISKYKTNYHLREFIGVQRGIWLGHRVRIKDQNSIGENVVVGNYTKLKKGALIKKNSIICENCQVLDSVEIDSSIVYHSVNIAKNTYLSEKIILKDRVICPFSGIQSILEYEKNDVSFSNEIYTIFPTFILFIFSLPSYILLKFILTLMGKKYFKQVEIRNIHGNIIKVELFNLSYLRRIKLLCLFNRISFAYYTPLFLLCLKGKIYLLGAGHLGSKGDGRSSVFSLSDKARDVDLQVGSDIYNGYYLYRRGIIYDNILILRLYFSNLIQIVR